MIDKYINPYLIEDFKCERCKSEWSVPLQHYEPHSCVVCNNKWIKWVSYKPSKFMYGYYVGDLVPFS